jgi:hypothetical protein
MEGLGRAFAMLYYGFFGLLIAGIPISLIVGVLIGHYLWR